MPETQPYTEETNDEFPTPVLKALRAVEVVGTGLPKPCFVQCSDETLPRKVRGVDCNQDVRSCKCVAVGCRVHDQCEFALRILDCG